MRRGSAFSRTSRRVDFFTVRPLAALRSAWLARSAGPRWYLVARAIYCPLRWASDERFSAPTGSSLLDSVCPPRRLDPALRAKDLELIDGSTAYSRRWHRGVYQCCDGRLSS